MKKYLSMIAVLVCTACFVFAEGTISETPIKLGNPDRLAITWTSSTNSFAELSTSVVRGEVKRVIFVPSSTAIPLAAYDVTLKDAAGNDILAGLGANLASNAVSTIVPGILVTDGITSNAVPYVVNDILTVGVTNCGSAKSGQIILYYQK